MFIVSKIDIYENKCTIIKVVEEGTDFDKLIAYDSLLKDALDNKERYSVKNVSGERLEVYTKGTFGNYLAYVYELHEVNEDDEEDENKPMEEVN